MGKLYVLHSDFSYIYVLQPCSLGKLYVLTGDFSDTLRTANLPVWKIICPVSDLSYALNAGKPAHWENSMSYPVIYPTLYVPEALPVGQIPLRSESSGQGRWNTFPKCAEFPVLVLHSSAPPLPSPPLRLVSPSRRSERASERA
jgi:hypothetical protein